MTATHTVVYVRREPANPYLACHQCGARVRYWLERPGPPVNYPCGHQADYDDLCPSWGPVDGCRCVAELGYRPHPAEIA